MDLLLPRLDGFSVARALRGGDWAAPGPISPVSALSHPGDRARALEAGCDDFVSKPYAPAELRAILLRYLPTTAPAGERGAGPAPAAAPRARTQERIGRVLRGGDQSPNLELPSRRLESIRRAPPGAGSGAPAPRPPQHGA